MKTTLKILFFLMCAIPCVLSVVKSYQPKIDKYEKYIMDCRACEYTQRRLQSALLSYSDSNSPIGDVRDEDGFLRVEKLLMNFGGLEKNYNRSTKECFYVIVDKEVTCACHADVEQIEKNIEQANRMLDKKSRCKTSDLVLVIGGCIALLTGLFG